MYCIDIQTITRDAPVDLDENKSRPKWIFSSYSPLKTAPASLMADNEFSPEEIRLRYYLAASTGNGTQADQEATQMYNKINQDYKNILNNLNDIPKFMDDAEKKRPSRHDLSNVSLFNGTKSRADFENDFNKGNTNGFGNKSGNSSFGTQSAFGQNTTSANPFSKPPTSTFGQPQGSSAFGGKPAFGQTGFGNNASSTAGAAFGQPSAPAFGQSAFGKPPVASASSGFGQPAFGSSGFGQSAPKNPFAPAAASGGFGQPSTTFGQPAQASAFGQPSQPTTTFGQNAAPASAFGQPSQPQSAFGQPSQPTSTFGQTAQPTTSAFGQPSKPGTGFGQPQQPASPFGQAPQSTAFGQTNQPGSAFGQQTQPSSSAFGKPAFGQSSQSTSVFGQGSKPATGFGTAFGQPAQQATNGFGANNGSTAFGQQASQINATPDTGMATDTTQPTRPNPFGVRQASSGATNAAQPGPQGGTGSDTLNPTNPLIGRTAAPLHITQTLPPQPAQTGMGGKVSSYRAQRTTYAPVPDKFVDSEPVPQDPVLCYTRPDTRQEEKIWFPSAGKDVTVTALSNELKKFDFQAKDEDYTQEVIDQYKHLYETGKFEGGKVPLVPPKREWVAYDF